MSVKLFMQNAFPPQESNQFPSPGEEELVERIHAKFEIKEKSE